MLDQLAANDKRVKVIHFRRNFGQTAAMMAGIDFATGEIIIPMDGDLQNDPADIPRLIAALDEGYDVVSGWRKDRQDARITRTLPSNLANRLISRVLGVRLHDYGCSLKAYRRDVIKDVKLYGEMHRFVPVYASWQGARVTEIPVTHHARQFGESKYGLERTIKVVLDLIVVKFLAKYAAEADVRVRRVRPVLARRSPWSPALWALYLKFFEDISLVQTPLPAGAGDDGDPGRDVHPDGPARRAAHPHLSRVAGQARLSGARDAKRGAAGRCRPVHAPIG